VRKNAVWIIIVIILGAFVINTIRNISANDSTIESQKSFVDSMVNADNSSPVNTPSSTWSYRTDSDKMDGSKSFFAQLYSTNQLEFAFPYNGGSSGVITIRKRNGKNEVILDITKGQFLDNISDDRYVRMKFDSQKLFSVSYSGTTDYRSTEIFLNSPSLIISKLKKSKKLLLDIEFYEAGRQQFEFDVANLVWEH
jgi:hypothetical protein